MSEKPESPMRVSPENPEEGSGYVHEHGTERILTPDEAKEEQESVKRADGVNNRNLT